MRTQTFSRSYFLYELPNVKQTLKIIYNKTKILTSLTFYNNSPSYLNFLTYLPAYYNTLNVSLHCSESLCTNLLVRTKEQSQNE